MPFMKTGFNLVETNDIPIDSESMKMITALMNLFMEDVVRTAIRYTRTVGRDEVGPSEVRKSLMYQAQNFFSQDESLEERYAQMMQEMQTEEEEEGEEEDGEEGGEETEEETEDECGEDDSEAADLGTNEENLELVTRMNACEECWSEWVPTDPILLLLKRSIDNVDYQDHSRVESDT